MYFSRLTVNLKMYLRKTFILSLLIFFMFSLTAEDKKVASNHEWYHAYANYIEWEELLHPSQILPVPLSKRQDTIERLKENPFFEINQEEARWFLNDEDFNASNILAEVISEYLEEARSEEKNAIMLKATKNTTEAFMAEHKAIKYKRKAEELKRILLKPKLFLMRGLVPDHRFLSKGKFEMFYNLDIQGMLLNYTTADLKYEKCDYQPVVVVLKEVYPKLYVTVNEKFEK